jgi:hypothetical protein
MILHSSGIASVRVADLTYDVKRQLGYTAPEIAGSATNATTVAARQLSQVSANLQPLQASLTQNFEAQREMIQKLGPRILMIILGALVVFHLFFAYCARLICLKAGSPDSFLIWLPVFQTFPLLRAAGMSGWWFLGLLIPGINVIGGVLWCINIVKARNKHVLVAIMLMLPILNILAFLYLAFSGGDEADPEPEKKFQPTALQTA